jgi:hypothetical protein
MISFNKILKIITSVILLLLFFTVYQVNTVNAQTVTMSDFIDGRGGPTHTLSTGEVISYTSDPGPSAGRDYFRMYKNSNYEQLYIESSGIGRREDTSWAPLPGFGDATCDVSGNKAIYTLDPGCNSYTDGQQVINSGANWAPNSASVGTVWNTETHQIVIIDSGQPPGGYNYNLPPLYYCDSTNGSPYAACSQSSSLQLTEFYPANTFTFCTGIQNTEDMIKITTLAGPGTGDTFYFMRDWGFVGFEAPGFEAHLMDPGGGDPSGCLGGGSTPPPPPPQATPTPVYGLMCVGIDLADYMNTVVNTAGNLSNIRLTTPAFNMTNDLGAEIALSMDDQGANWGGIDAIAGISYNCCNNSITGHVGAFRSALSGTGLDGKPVLLVETGDLGERDIDELSDEMDTIQSSSGYVGALLYNVFGTNPDPNLNIHEYGDDDISAICGGSCSKLGANSAVYYGNENYNADETDFYGHAQSLGMTFTLSISGADSYTTQAVLDAIGRGLTPVIRVGTAFNAGPNADDYANYLVQLNNAVANQYPGSVVYAIAGPNEPQTQCWAAPNCGCDITSGPNADPIGSGRHPLDEGFFLAKYTCIVPSEDPEFHPLRPYPASSCDLLIPRSYPEAPLSTLTNPEVLADYLKYNTFACGTNLAFGHMERFDPYGYYDYYGLNSGNNVINTNGVQYLHTYCPPVDPATSQTTGTYTQTCYRTIVYDIYTDFSRAILGIYGNTQNSNFTDEQKVNNYLGWYFSGTSQLGDRVLLDPADTESSFATPSGTIRWSDIDRLINFSGPLRKLLPYDAIQIIRSVLPDDVDNNDGSGDENIHDYAVDTQQLIRLSGIFPGMEEFFTNIPNSTLEDIPGEAYPSALAQGVGAIADPASGLSTAPDEFNITCAVGAHLTCPGLGSPSPPGNPPPPGDIPPPPGGSTGGCYDACDPSDQYPCQANLTCRDRFGSGDYLCWNPICDVTPTPTPIPGNLCYSSCYSTADCQSGLQCVPTAGGSWCFDPCLCGGVCP